MVDDPHDHNRIPVDMVEHTVPPVDQAAYAFAQISAGCSGHRMLAQKRKGCIKPKEIGVSDLATKSINAVNPNGKQIGACCRAKVKFSHFLPDIRQLSHAAHLQGVD